MLTQLDQQLLRFARTRGHTPARERAAALFSKTGEHAACWLALGATGAIADRERRAPWLRGAAAVAASYGLNTAVKYVVRRPRPQLPELPPLTSVVSGYSFPSAHATTSFTAAKVYGALIPGAPLYAAAGLLAVSRPYLGVHYPSDVIVGAVLGTVLGVAVCR